MIRIGGCLPGVRAAIVTGLFLLGHSLGLGATAQPASDHSRWVQVRLHHDIDPASAQLTPERGTLSVRPPGGGAPIFQLRPQETVTLGRRQGDVYAIQGDTRLYARSLHLAPAREATWTLKLARESTRTYTGHLHFRPAESESGLQLVNRVPLRDYVASVVTGEYGFEDGAGTRAMAVVARTYALFSAKHFDGAYDHVDGTASQVYRGQDIVTEAARAAAQATRGEILTYDGAPIQAVYFSSSGGHTANNEDVWTGSDPLPYLRGKKDPFDRSSPKHRWTTRIHRRSLLQILSLHHNASVKGFLLGDRIADRRLRTIEILFSDGTETKMEAETFRSVVNEGVDDASLKSTWFDARREGSEYVFEGRGHGHGVGLNQWGAHAMAEQGKSYREILTFYYAGVQIQQLDEVSSPPQLAKDPVPEAPDSTSTRIGW